MIEKKKSSIFRFIIWGSIFGFLAGYFMTRLSEIYMYSNVFGGPYFGPDAITNYDKAYAHLMMYVINFAQFIILGIFLGLANGISNKSVSKTIYSVLGGVIAALLCFLYYAKKESYALSGYAYGDIPRYLYFYAASIIVLCNLRKSKIDEMWLSLFWSIIFIVPWIAFWWLISFLSAFSGFGGYDPHTFFWRRSHVLYYIYFPLGGILSILGINVTEWKKKLGVAS